MEVKKPVISPKETKEYLACNQIPQLFECLMTGLMYHQPVDPVQYLQQCLEDIKKKDYRSVRWDMFLEKKHCSLPSVSFGQNNEQFSKYQPLPGTACSRFKIRPQAVIICVISPPGIGAKNFADRILNRYPNFVRLSMGDLLINCAKIEESKLNSPWASALCIIESGDLAPEDMVFELLTWNLNQHPTSEGFIIDGYPRTLRQYEDFKLNLCKDNSCGVILIDANEEKCMHQMLSLKQPPCAPSVPMRNDVIVRKLCTFKNVTLPVCKVIDNDCKLRVVDGEQMDEDVAREMLIAFDSFLSRRVSGIVVQFKQLKPEKKCPSKELNRPILPTINISKIHPDYKDNGRKDGLPTCPIMIILGGPGSGRTNQAQALCRLIKGTKHYDITDILRQRILNTLSPGAEKDWDIVAKRVHSSEPPLSYDRMIPEYWAIQSDVLRDEFIKLAENASLVVIEGCMNDENQISTFNQIIGGADMVVLLDCEEETLVTRLNRRFDRLKYVGDESHIVHQRVNFFKHVTLSVMRYFDELGKLVTIPADRDSELITRDLVAFVEYFMAKWDNSNKGRTNISECT